MSVEYKNATRTLVAEVKEDKVRISIGLAGTTLAVVDMHLTKDEAGAWALALLEELT